MLTLFGLGFVLGLRHALEADHAAAVASLATQNRSVVSHDEARHCLGIRTYCDPASMFGSIVLIIGVVIPEGFADALECAVGFMLVGLGLDVFRRMQE